MKIRIGLATLGAALLAALALAVTPEPGRAQRSPLITGGARSNFGQVVLMGGFMPDPSLTNVVSGGSIDVSPFSLAPGCRGYVTAQPDLIFRYNNPRSWLRIFFRGQGDTTLVINDGAGRWFCDDDSGGSLNPMVDLPSPAGGQYDIWVGSYRAGENIRGQLGITELSSVRP